MKGIVACTLIALGCTPLQGLAGDPMDDADMVGRDLNVPLLGAIGHVGMWVPMNGGRVIEMLDEAVPLQINKLEDFKSRTRYWGAAYYPQLRYRPYVKICNDMRLCDRMISFPAQVALAYQAHLWVAAGAQYTTTTIVVPPRPGYYEKSTPFPWGGNQKTVYRRWTPGLFRCDTFVRNVWQTGGAVPDSAFPGAQLPYVMFNAFAKR